MHRFKYLGEIISIDCEKKRGEANRLEKPYTRNLPFSIEYSDPEVLNNLKKGDLVYLHIETIKNRRTAIIKRKFD